MRRLTGVAALLVAVAVAGGSRAGKDAADILRKIDAAESVRSSKMRMVQEVITPAGDRRTFKIVSYSKDNGAMGLTEYVAPASVRGMKILTRNDGDDIWAYFPRTNRVRKIASSARNRRVQGSDFTYEDMASGKMSTKWKGTVEGTEKMGGMTCWKLVLRPTPKGPRAYSKIVAWVDQKAYRTVRIDYFDRDGVRFKRLTLDDYRQVSGHWVPFHYEMRNLEDGGRTVVRVSDVRMDVPLKDGLFDPAALGR